MMLREACFSSDFRRGLLWLLVAQCSAIGVSAAVTPLCSGIRIWKEILPRHLWHFNANPPPLQSHVFSPLSRALRTQLRQGVGKQVRHNLWGGVARHSCDCRDTVCATLCSVIGFTARVRHKPLASLNSPTLSLVCLSCRGAC